jgi:hypothetical protein
MDANQRWTNHIFTYIRKIRDHLFILNPNHPMPSSSVTSAGIAEHPQGSSQWLEEGVTPHVSKPHDYVNHMFMRL